MGKFFFDFFPLILFYAVYKKYDLYMASGVIMAASFLQVAYSLMKHKKVENMHLISFVVVTIMGAATIILRNEMFLKWKITAVNILFGCAFLFSHFVGKKVIIERMLDGKIELPKKQLHVLNIMWTIFFFFLAIANTYIIYNFSTDTWVNFKVYGVLILTLIFTLIQGTYIAIHLREKQ